MNLLQGSRQHFNDEELCAAIDRGDVEAALLRAKMLEQTDEELLKSASLSDHLLGDKLLVRLLLNGVENMMRI